MTMFHSLIQDILENPVYLYTLLIIWENSLLLKVAVILEFIKNAYLVLVPSFWLTAHITLGNS